MSPRILVLTLFFNLVHAQEEQPDRFATMPAKHLDLIEQYCYDCYDSASEKGEINLEDLSFHISKDIPHRRALAKNSQRHQLRRNAAQEKGPTHRPGKDRLPQ